MAFWNGSTFSNISKDPSLGYQDFSSCWAADNDTLFTGLNTGGIAKWDHLGNNQTILHDQYPKTVSGIVGTASNDVYFTGYAGLFVHYNGTTATPIIPVDTWRRNTMVRGADGAWIVGADQGVQRFDNGQMTQFAHPWRAALRYFQRYIRGISLPRGRGQQTMFL